MKRRIENPILPGEGPEEYAIFDTEVSDNLKKRIEEQLKRLQARPDPKIDKPVKSEFDAVEPSEDQS